MRRSDREQSREFGLKVIDDTNYGVLTIKKNGYSIPLTFIRDEEILYFHGAVEGEKVDNILNGDIVRIVFVSQSEVPRQYTKERMREIIGNGGNSSGKIFTIEYKSTIIEGPVSEVTDREEKIHSFKLMCEKYDPEMMEFFEHAINRSMDRTRVYKIQIKEITSKAKEVVKM